MQENKTPFISLIVPCYNEERVIARTLEAVVSYLAKGGYEWEVLVVDDGSIDSTVAMAREWAGRSPGIRVLENVTNRGKGYSVRRGFLEAKGRYVIFTDADLSTPVEEVEKMVFAMAEGFDVAIGSRAMRESMVEIHQPWWRELMGKTFNLFVRALAVRGIRDTQCGFKCFKREAARKVFSRQTIDGFGFDVEALYLARKFGYSIKEVPVRWINRFESRVNPILHPLQMALDLLRIRLLDLAGRYR